MKEIKELEMQLHSWVPRRPSAKLKRRLFSAHPAPAKPLPASRFAWLAPAAAALLLACALLNQRNGPTLSNSADSGPLVAMALSNQSAAAWLPGSFQCDQNSLPAETFEWTNGRGSTSSITSPSGSRGSN